MRGACETRAFEMGAGASVADSAAPAGPDEHSLKRFRALKTEYEVRFARAAPASRRAAPPWPAVATEALSVRAAAER